MVDKIPDYYKMASTSHQRTMKYEEKSKRAPWTTPEKRVVHELFGNNIKYRKLPRFAECVKATEERPELHKRTSNQLYAYINNQIQRSRNTFSDTMNSAPLKPKIRRIKWTTAEKRVVHELFENDIINLRLPLINECEEAIRRPELHRRSPRQVYAFIHNQIKNLRRFKSEKCSSQLTTISKNESDVQRFSWTRSEKKVVDELFGKNFQHLKLPRFDECERAIQNCPELHRRTSNQLFAHISNKIKSLRQNNHSDPMRRSLSKTKIRSEGWTTAEKRIVHELFKTNINFLKVPEFTECREAIIQHPELRRRTTKELYVFINNQIKDLRRRFLSGNLLPQLQWLMDTVLKILKTPSGVAVETENPPHSGLKDLIRKYPELKRIKLYAIQELLNFENERNKCTKAGAID